ncbi:MAG: peptidylprolyl isomerase [Nitrospirae bacterium]|nr:peptidylprolyl isomerase [Nitrospirota bacterium]
MQAKHGDKVKVHYTLKINDGEVVDSSAGTAPLEFTLGGGGMIPGFESGVIGMSAGEKKTINIPADLAYGVRNEKMVFEFPKERCPEGFEPQPGQQIQLNRPDGKSFVATVAGVTASGYTMDANHPLAGRDLTFDLELVEISA